MADITDNADNTDGLFRRKRSFVYEVKGAPIGDGWECVNSGRLKAGQV